MSTWGETKVDLTLAPSTTFGNHFAHNAFGAGYFQAEQKFPKCSACWWWWCLLQAWIQTRKNKTASVEHMLRSSGSNKQKRNSRYAGTVYVCMYLKSISR